MLWSAKTFLTNWNCIQRKSSTLLRGRSSPLDKIRNIERMEIAADIWWKFKWPLNEQKSIAMNTKYFHCLKWIPPTILPLTLSFFSHHCIWLKLRSQCKMQNGKRGALKWMSTVTVIYFAWKKGLRTLQPSQTVFINFDYGCTNSLYGNIVVFSSILFLLSIVNFISTSSIELNWNVQT